MNDISNRTLVFLTIIAIFFTLFGTATILSRLGQPVPLITGLGTTSEDSITIVVKPTLDAEQQIFEETKEEFLEEVNTTEKSSAEMEQEDQN